jgi:hypothetical protein
MIFSRRPNGRTFLGVGIALILVGSAITAVSGVEWASMMFHYGQYGWPAAKLVGGLIVLALGYIVLELELIRLKKET